MKYSSESQSLSVISEYHQYYQRYYSLITLSNYELYWLLIAADSIIKIMSFISSIVH